MPVCLLENIAALGRRAAWWADFMWLQTFVARTERHASSGNGSPELPRYFLGREMTAQIIEFPITRRTPFAVHVVREDSAWLVLAGAHGWAHGDRAAALKDARWLSKNLSYQLGEFRDDNH